MTRFPVDQGTQFGTWPDDTSRFMYHDVMPELLAGVNTTGSVCDLGGGNGLLRRWIPQARTVDVDPSKEPDVVCEALEYQGTHDLVVMRYLLHYLDDAQVRALFTRLAQWHAGRVLVVQFVNDDLEAKRANSMNEDVRYFRTEAQLLALLEPWQVQRRTRVDYQVQAEFYRNRLQHPNPTSHAEAVVSLLLTPGEDQA